MNELYDFGNVPVNENIEIEGCPFYAEDIQPTESYNRRELNRTSILGGTEFVSPGKYIPREFSFTTSILIPEGKPHVHDALFSEMMSKPCEVISPYMGGIFDAEVIIKKSPETPSSIHLDITVKEIPKTESNIPNEQITLE